MIDPTKVRSIRFACDLGMARHLKREADSLSAVIREDMAKTGATTPEKVTLLSSYEYLARRYEERLYRVS